MPTTELWSSDQPAEKRAKRCQRRKTARYEQDARLNPQRKALSDLKPKLFLLPSRETRHPADRDWHHVSTNHRARD